MKGSGFWWYSSTKNMELSAPTCPSKKQVEQHHFRHVLYGPPWDSKDHKIYDTKTIIFPCFSHTNQWINKSVGQLFLQSAGLAGSMFMVFPYICIFCDKNRKNTSPMDPKGFDFYTTSALRGRDLCGESWRWRFWNLMVTTRYENSVGLMWGCEPMAW